MDERQKMVDSKEKLSQSKQCILLKVNRNFIYSSSKGKNDENIIIMDLLKKQYIVMAFYGYRKMTV
ncbi:hypothetical protein RCH18_002340 [Flavobacterium sp. PL11]|jgi:hypothetical protein|uniref:hypothetical protein n=1 Tax=Flavobacterium sp. PL11 TaxID=3071717 RepID=UPI002E0B938B|nr:hypothetical protein [Flavobacterium sp. PL11]